MRRTSVEAYRKIKAEGLLTRLQEAVYEAVYASGPVTASEAAKLVQGQPGLEARQIDSLRPRMAELSRRGVVEAVGERRCSVSGKTAILWDVTDGLPAVQSGQRSNKNAALAAEVESLRRRLAEAERELAFAKDKLRRWGRPTEKERLEKSIRSRTDCGLLFAP